MNPFAAIDMAIFRFAENKLLVYIVKLKLEPFSGKLALPGSLLQSDEDLRTAARRVFFEATGSQKAFFEQVYTFSAPDRDVRRRSIATAYMAFPESDVALFEPCEKYTYGQWRDAFSIHDLAYDHDQILSVCRERIASKLNYTSIALLLLPQKFTLTEMQKLYEYCLQRNIDKRNFRKKILSLNIIKPTGEKRLGRKARPAMLYQAVSRSLETIPLFR